MFIPTAKTVRAKTSDMAPIAMIKVKTINKIQVNRPFACLLDTGSTGTMTQSRALPLGIVPHISPYKRVSTTTIQFPEFANGKVIGGVKANLFCPAGCRCDIIFCRDLCPK